MERHLPISFFVDKLSRLLWTNPRIDELSRRLAGRVLAVGITGFNHDLLLQVEPSRMRLLPITSVQADIRITGSTPALLWYLLGLQRQVKDEGDVVITGNATVAQDFQHLFQGIDLDVEERLSATIGDVAAHRIGIQGRKFFDWSRASAESVLFNLGEALQYEWQLMPAKEELEAFARQIGTLRGDVDRMAARLERLRDRIE